jgi:NAD(P)-dependent dehydrogenase (short-subunit alcohol dehydrogenase family)
MFTVPSLHQNGGGPMGKLDDKVAVITGATSGMALATARLFVEEGAYVFVTGRRKDKLDEAVRSIGGNVTGVQGDASSLADLDRLYETVKREKGRIDVLFASAGTGEFAPIGEVTEEQFDRTFGLNVRGTLFTVQKALPLSHVWGGAACTDVFRTWKHLVSQAFHAELPPGNPKSVVTISLGVCRFLFENPT